MPPNTTSGASRASKAQHTPGPWFTLRGAGPKLLGSHIIRSATGKCEVARASDQFMCRAERLANARLIAAAPDLLQALYAVQSALSDLPDDARAAIPDAMECRVRTAIAKATGQGS